MKHLVNSLLAAVLILGAGSSVLADNPFNVDFTIGWDNCYRPMQWTPVEIGINSRLARPFGGMVTVTTQTDEMNSLTIGHQFVLTPDVRLYLPLVTKLAFSTNDCSVRIADTNGKTCWSKDYNLWNFATSQRQITALGREDILIGLVGRRAFSLPQLAKHTSSKSQNKIGKVYVKDKLPRMIPWDWTGFASLDVLVLYDPDWDLINAHQAGAIARWVTNGGKLLVVLGSHPLSADHPLAKFLPFETGQAKKTLVPADMLKAWGLNPSLETSVIHRPLKAKANPLSGKLFERKSPPTHGAGLIFSLGGGGEHRGGAEVHTPHEPNSALFATTFVGFGQVGVLGFDPAALTPSRKVDTARFWVRHLSALLGHSNKPGHRRITLAVKKSKDQDDNYYHHELDIAGKGLNSIFVYLLNIPELQPLSIWWVIGLLLILTILLGPVDYCVLKHLDRQPLTWITSAVCIALFTIGAYFGVQAIRSGKAQVRAISVLDGIQGTNTGWSTTYMGLFAPQSDQYKLENLKANQWWSGIAPSREYLYRHSRGGDVRRIFCLQHDGGNLPDPLPINIWSMQCMMSESPVREIPFSAEVKRISGGKLLVAVTNKSDYPISRGYVRLDKGRVMEFVGVPAGQTREFQSYPVVTHQWGEKYEITSPDEFTNDVAYFARGSLRRTRTIEAYLKQGAAVVCVEYDQAPVSFSVANHRCDNTHIQLVRLVVFPQKEQTK